ncbi:MAG: 30S ribosomal protein S8e [Candidatus Rehaiarchaeum fermentans]|nr:30S ribosomal protein S8e [Candidatus Rehaiarchaeum fermentans]MCW1292831.1 30S ribosomal protein S8e [Candidatus Rehaiarchaeum fermentans]MCW1293396.1 30S ribosomal protein S8e [Candidatus Rehaiarchaeum fermentans]MCW1311316.1 30S ribosomal protein S8e [Candidatus Rehaiarchaeum fermentans]
MGISTGDDGRKRSGGLKGKWRDKRRYEITSPSSIPTLGERKIKIVRGRGANKKVRILSDNYGILFSKNEKPKKVKIIKVLENAANREYARRFVLTKGAIVETEAGKGKIISRPGQDGIINILKIE